MLLRLLSHNFHWLCYPFSLLSALFPFLFIRVELQQIEESLAMSDGIRFFDLNTGAKIPSVGLGSAQVDPGRLGEAVVTAIKVFFFTLNLRLSGSDEFNSSRRNLIIVSRSKIFTYFKNRVLTGWLQLKSAEWWNAIVREASYEIDSLDLRHFFWEWKLQSEVFS